MPKRKDIEPAETLPSTVQAYKKSPRYILESILTPYDYLPDDVKILGLFQANDPVYLRSQIVRLESRNTWRHTHMRRIKAEERPKRVISRNVGAIQRSIELFSFDQTEPLENLIASQEKGIPSNEYGNVEFDRVPQNAVIIETPDIARAIRICRAIKNLAWCRCQNGWRRRSPNYIGIVVLKEDEERVRTALQSAENESRENEKKARDAAALAIWRVLTQRMKAEYYIRNVIDKS
jgi:hypothetical protein